MEASAIKTPLGIVTVVMGESDVSLRFEPSSGIACGDCRRDADGTVVTRLWTVARRPPATYDEVTQNGHTFEVQGVRMKEGGGHQIKNEQGVWEDWVES